MYKTKNINYFEKIDIDHKAYWLGFLYADGYILQGRKEQKNESDALGISLARNDIYLLEILKEDLKSENPIKFYQNSRKSNYKDTWYGRLIIYSNKMTADLIDKGCLKNKTFKLKFPSDTQVPKHLLHHFIRGYFDGDGSLYRQKNRCKYGISFCGTKEMLEGIRNFLGKENVKLRQRWPERNNNNYYLALCGNKQIEKIMSILYKDATIFLKRKHEVFELLQKENMSKDRV